MNDEIKQIIEDIKLTLDVTVKDMVLLNRKDIKQLLDYITNLQQKIKIKDTNWESLKYYLQRLFDKSYIEEEIFDDICKKVNELESQIEIKGYQKDIEHLQQINKNLTNSLNKKVEEGIKLQLENERLKKVEKDYKEKFDKTIEYLELRRYSNEDGKPSLDLDEYDCVPLLNILQGEKNE